MNLRAPQNAGNFETSLGTTGFPRRNLLYGFSHLLLQLSSTKVPFQNKVTHGGRFSLNTVKTLNERVDLLKGNIAWL